MVRLFKALAVLALFACAVAGLRAEDELVLVPRQVAPDVYAFIGARRRSRRRIGATLSIAASSSVRTA